MKEYIKDIEHLDEVLDPPKSYFGTDGARHFYDYSGKYVNTSNGHRVTIEQPKNPKRAIWFLGPCILFGVGARDEGTIASHLQVLCNKYATDCVFIVHNYGYYVSSARQFKHGYDVQRQEDENYTKLTTLPIKIGDIVILWQNYPNSFEKIDVSIQYPHDYGAFFWDNCHMTENGYKFLADRIFLALKEHDFFQDTTEVIESSPIAVATTQKTDFGLSPEQLELMELYKSSLSTFYEQQFGNSDTPPKIGSIVMNCNPFTLGHRYLIEQAAAMVDFLVIFVVQEDLSFFPFEDRIDLVDKGTEDLPNVGVIESGNFIISTITFSEYFNKSEIQDMVVDSSNDVTLFAQEIAPSMHISVRFAGEEPFDRITKQYNDTLSVILPRHGIDFIKIPRLEIEGEAVSASRVRSLLKQHNWDAVKKLVPPTTFEYLKERF